MPSGKITKFLWYQYQREKKWVNQADIIGACNWLIANAEDGDFRWAMVAQKNFFLSHGGW